MARRADAIRCFVVETPAWTPRHAHGRDAVGRLADSAGAGVAARGGAARRRRSGAPAVRLLRSRDHRAERRRRHVRVSRRLRLVRRGRRVRHAAVRAHPALPTNARCSTAVAAELGARRRARQLQRQVVRRAAPRNALPLPSPRMDGRAHAARRRAASRAPLLA